MESKEVQSCHWRFRTRMCF